MRRPAVAAPSSGASAWLAHATGWSVRGPTKAWNGSLVRWPSSSGLVACFCPRPIPPGWAASPATGGGWHARPWLVCPLRALARRSIRAANVARAVPSWFGRRALSPAVSRQLLAISTPRRAAERAPARGARCCGHMPLNATVGLNAVSAGGHAGAPLALAFRTWLHLLRMCTLHNI